MPACCQKLGGPLLAFSRQFQTIYGPSVQAMDTQLGARPRRPRRFTEVVLNEEPLPVAYTLRGHE